ncbi:hypothetical protein M565_ctg5P0499 [Vibrio cyclitrophicus FF75]|nr:hypothetical protein M565_ctg5P0499 [Vibrio cyclitrophicus FF75]
MGVFSRANQTKFSFVQRSQRPKLVDFTLQGRKAQVTGTAIIGL